MAWAESPWEAWLREPELHRASLVYETNPGAVPVYPASSITALYITILPYTGSSTIFRIIAG